MITKLTRLVRIMATPTQARKKIRIEATRLRPHVKWWREDLDFTIRYGRIRQRTLLDRTRAFMLYEMARNALTLPGEVAELGVYRGGTAQLLAELFTPTGKHLHLFDTFAGMPEPDARDLHLAGDFADTSLEAVSALLEGYPGVKIHPGYFPQTAASVKDAHFCMVHIDADLAQSATDACAFFYPRMVPGGVMVFDDYGFRSCPGARHSVDAFFARTPERPIRLTTTQCMIVKR